MSNVLGTLFSDIAAAIRSKNGETETMKPAQFPEKISAIETGAAKDVTARNGSFTPSSASTTIEHGLGVAPDLVIVFAAQAIASSGTLITACVGFSKASVGNKMYITNGSEFSTASPITTNNSDMEALGMIRAANTTSFKVGGSSGSFASVEYRWYAISGIF